MQDSVNEDIITSTHFSTVFEPVSRYLATKYFPIELFY
jgi:hypothetical protein